MEPPRPNINTLDGDRNIPLDAALDLKPKKNPILVDEENNRQI